jgi:hypothetical protein
VRRFNRDKDKKCDQHNFRFCKTHQCFREMSLCETSDSDVSSETEDWKMPLREPIEFIVFESEESNAVLDFIRNENINDIDL